MEFPIKVVITLFISVIIGVAIINFATDAFDDSKVKLKEFSDKEKEDLNENILEVNSISSKQLAGLAKECFENNQESLESVVCFAVIGDMNANNQGVYESSTLNESYLYVDLNESVNAVKVKYNAIEGRVEITG